MLWSRLSRFVLLILKTITNVLLNFQNDVLFSENTGVQLYKQLNPILMKCMLSRLPGYNNMPKSIRWPGIIIRKLLLIPSAVRIALNTFRYEAIAEKNKIIYINPDNVSLKLNNEKAKKTKWLPGEIIAGNWDLDIRTYPPTRNMQYNTVYQRFVEGIPWEETERFTKVYPKRLKEKGHIRGCKSIEQLAENYYQNVDPLYWDIKNNGFRHSAKKNERYEKIYIYIGRNGELIYSYGGNHRLHIAKILGLTSIPVYVRVRHAQWQKHRSWFIKK